MRSTLLYLIIVSFLFSCSANYEVVNPYKNWFYSGDRLFPVKLNNSEFSLRIWISNSTSIDRVISVFKDSTTEFDKIYPKEFEGNLIEFGKLFNGKRYSDFYNEIEIKPKDGFIAFKRKLDSLNLLELKSKADIPVVLHEPISYYVIELKDKGKYNIFRFATYFPKNSGDNDQYYIIEQFIFDQFDLKQRFRFKE